MRILVTGASGLLGLNFSLEFSNEHDIIGIVNNTLLNDTFFRVIKEDLTDEKKTRKLIQKIRPNLILNCAALANIDDCEKYPEIAFILNTALPRWIAEECANHKIRLIQISTDAVFNGKKQGKYEESDLADPQNVYAKTKLDGENAVKQAYPSALIARVNFFGFSVHGNRSLAEYFLYNLQKENPIKGFTDVEFCPLYVRTLSRILIDMVNNGLSGLYHVVGSETISKYQFGIMLADVFHFDSALISPTSVEDVRLIAQRSHNLALNTKKLESNLPIHLPDVKQGLDDLFVDYQKGLPKKIRSCVI